MNRPSQTFFLWGAAALLLIAAVILFALYLSRPFNYLPYLEQKLESEVMSLNAESDTLIARFSGQSELNFSDAPPNLHFNHFIYRNTTVVYWSDYRYVPDYADLVLEDSLNFISTQRHDMLVTGRQIPDTEYLLVSVLPLADRYQIDNRYVSSGINESLFGTDRLTIVPEGEEVCIQGYCLFSIQVEEPIRHTSYARYALILFWLAGIMITILMVIASWRMLSINAMRGFWQLVGYLVVLRAMTLIFDFPQVIYATELFDSRYFASSAVNPSLGDLFINLFFVLIITSYLFRALPLLKLWVEEKLVNQATWLKWIISVLLAGSLLMAFHYQYLFLQTLYNNSQLSFDINESIQFDLQRITGLGIFVVNAIIAFLLFHIAFNLLVVLTRKKILFPMAIAVVLFSFVNATLGQVFLVPLLVALVFASVIWTSRLYKELWSIRYRSFLYLFSGIVATSVLGAWTIEHFESIRERTMKVRYANQFLIENDNLAEFLLNETVSNISRDPYIQNKMSSPFFSKDQIKRKIRREFLSSYFDKYDVSIYLYNPRNMPFDLPAEYPPDVIQSWRTSEFKTTYDNIYFLSRLDGQPTKRYITLIPIRRRGIVTGYAILDMSLKRIVPESVYPELLVDNRFLSPYVHADLSYAIIDGRQITYNAGEFNYQKYFNPAELEDEALYDEGIEYRSYNHLGVRDDRGRVVIISSREHPISHIISNFSFEFLLLVSLILLASGFYAAYYYFRNVDLTYTVRIQLYLNLAFFMPLIAVSITTLSVITSSFKKELQEEYLKKAENISRNISTDLEYYRQGRNIDLESLGSEINLNLIGKVVGTDVNLFSSATGRLLATSQPLIYENELLSNYINPEAILEIKESGESYHLATESVGTLTYSNTFFGIKSYDSGDLLGILSIPYFQSAYELERNQINVLTNVMNIFTIIFIIFLVLSSLASSWLTFPLKLITQRLKKTTLTGDNEPLSWGTEDEIGMMVREYNRMLENLEQSKKALARNEKETAWREIAQQVAHEIKNPLTPMKLTLQHLSRRFANGKEELNKSIESLLAQVDTLSEIASSFSSFAKLPIPEQERFELTSVIKNTIALFDTTENLTLNAEIPEESIFCIGDEQLMGRIFSNILLNAIQAHQDGLAKIDIRVLLADNRKVVIEFKDYGFGIDESIQGKVFIPNFTTKESGSGIGLAVAKHGVEHAGGKIWFETEKEEGTTFYIELPVVP